MTAPVVSKLLTLDVPKREGCAKCFMKVPAFHVVKSGCMVARVCPTCLSKVVAQ